MEVKWSRGEEDILTDLKTEMREVKNYQWEMEIIQSQLETFQYNMSELKESIKIRFKYVEETIEEEITEIRTDMVQVIEEKVEQSVTSMSNEVKNIESGTEDKHEEHEKLIKSLEAKVVQLFTPGVVTVGSSVASSSRVEETIRLRITSLVKTKPNL